MTQEEQIRLYRLMEKLNWFFHQEMHYLDRETAEKIARECYPEIRDFTYDILWNDLPKEVQEQLMDEEESLMRSPWTVFLNSTKTCWAGPSLTAFPPAAASRNCGSAWNGSTSGYLLSTLPLDCADLYWLRRWNCNVHNCL